MTRFIIAAAAVSVALAGPAFAGDKQKRTFTRDGVTYTYTSTKTDDATVLEGRAHPYGGNFRLVVKGDKVTGHAGNDRVSFRVSDKKIASN